MLLLPIIRLFAEPNNGGVKRRLEDLEAENRVLKKIKAGLSQILSLHLGANVHLYSPAQVRRVPWKHLPRR